MLKQKPAIVVARPIATHFPTVADLSQAMVVVDRYAYRVDFGPQVSPRVHFVSKDKTCSCLDLNCPSIEAVRQYVAGGGERAPEVPFYYMPVAPKACPICAQPAFFYAGLSTRAHGAGWICRENGERHYWKWRTELLKRFADENPWRFPPVVVRQGQQLNAWDGVLASDQVLYPGLRRDEIVTTV